MSYLLGIDLGSSSVKVALVDADSGQCIASASYPESEAPIKALQPGWAEQRPDDWWEYLKQALSKLSTLNFQFSTLKAIGISYQMHGLVCLDKEMLPLRDAIIWCDSRGVPYGERAFDELGHEWCMEHLHNSPGNFTASKLAWVKANEPELFDKIRYIMLPGDYLALRLTGTAATTACGLSEMMLWDYQVESEKWKVKSGKCIAEKVMDYFGFPKEMLPPLVPTFGEQGRLSASAATELGLPVGIPVSYRAGDQPNNALSLAVLNPGEVAATAGTSGVVYGVVESGKMKVESGRINTFLHVNHNLGVMHCINGCGILNAWMRRTLGARTASSAITYDEINRLAASVPVGSEGVSIIPFGNGAERVLENRNIGCSVHGLDFNRHNRAHLLRASQEGIAFALYYGMEIIGSVATIRSGRANMVLSPLFRETLASVSGATIELYDTDGAIGAARGAGLGSGVYATPEEAFGPMQRLLTVEPTKDTSYREAYERWKSILEKQ